MGLRPQVGISSSCWKAGRWMNPGYDSLGRGDRTTLPYTGNAGATNSTAPATHATYDSLGRPAVVSDNETTQLDLQFSCGNQPQKQNDPGWFDFHDKILARNPLFIRTSRPCCSLSIINFPPRAIARVANAGMLIDSGR